MNRHFFLVPGMLRADGQRYLGIFNGKQSWATTVYLKHTTSAPAVPFNATDPSTYGCFLALVRKAHDDATLSPMFLEKGDCGADEDGWVLKSRQGFLCDLEQKVLFNADEVRLFESAIALAEVMSRAEESQQAPAPVTECPPPAEPVSDGCWNCEHNGVPCTQEPCKNCVDDSMWAPEEDDVPPEELA